MYKKIFNKIKEVFSGKKEKITKEEILLKPNSSLDSKNNKNGNNVHHGYCIFSGKMIDFDINKPYSNDIESDVINKGLGEYCHFSGEKGALGDSSILKPIFYKNYEKALKKYGKNKCIPKIILDGFCYEPNIRQNYNDLFKYLVYEKLVNDIKPIIENFKLKVKEHEDISIIKNRAIADILRIIDNYFLGFNEKFSFFKAINEGYQFNGFYKYVIETLNKNLDNQIKNKS